MNRRSFLGMFAMVPLAGVAAVSAKKQQVVTELVIAADEVGAASLAASKSAVDLFHDTVSQCVEYKSNDTWETFLVQRGDLIKLRESKWINAPAIKRDEYSRVYVDELHEYKGGEG